jgi:small subunit ribosomal protein S3e
MLIELQAAGSAMVCFGFVIESSAKGCEIVVSGKPRAARAKSMKFEVHRRIHDS